MENAGKFIATFLVGAAAGVSLGLLLAPEKGDKTRKNFKKALDEKTKQADKKYKKYKKDLIK